YMHYILFNEKQYKHIKFKINSKSELSSIFSKMNEIEIPCLKLSKELLLHSIIELVNNSISAHIEKNVTESVHINISIENEDLHITIKDKGKGFNVNELPYNLKDPVSAIDINGKNFQDYREKYNYKRFGTGLFNAKKTFDDFELSFMDKSEKIVPYDSNEIEGTIIKLVLKK
nr:ATP-binding protein [Spirochaetaceae bacterium]